MDRFTILPPEIRNQIYGLLLVRPHAICITSRDAKPSFIRNFFPKNFNSLALVNRKVHNETVTIFYSLNVFAVGNGQWPKPNLRGFQALVHHTPPRHLSLIRKVRFVLLAIGQTRNVPDDIAWVPASTYNKRVETHLENVLRRLEESEVEVDILSLRIRVLGGHFMTPRNTRFNWKDLDMETKQLIEMLLQIGTEMKIQLHELARFVGVNVEQVERFTERVIGNKSDRPRNLMVVLNTRTSWQKPGLFEERQIRRVE